MVAHVRRTAQRTSTEPKAPIYPADAFALWARSGRVDRDAEVAAYLAGRAIDPAAVARADLARVLPGGALPRWARAGGRSWEETGHRLVVPACDHHGAIRTVRASRVREGDTPKRLAPAGHTSSGVVFCNAIAGVLLANPGAAEDMGAVRIVVCEGEPDFMTIATAPAWAGWAVVGVYSGSWTPEIAARIPDGARVLLGTDADATGNRYAADIGATLAARCRVERIESWAA